MPSPSDFDSRNRDGVVLGLLLKLAIHRSLDMANGPTPARYASFGGMRLLLIG